MVLPDERSSLTAFARNSSGYGGRVLATWTLLLGLLGPKHQGLHESRGNSSRQDECEAEAEAVRPPGVGAGHPVPSVPLKAGG